MQWVSSPLTAAVLSILLQGIIGASSSSDYKVVCYLESWSIYWKDPQLSFGPSNIDPFACTHLIHSFIGLDNSSFLVRILDPDYEVDKGGFKAAVDLKLINPQLKVMIAIGGWAEGGLQYSQMVSTRQRRKKFINSLVEFIETYQFDGLDFDWEYPGAQDRDGRPEDKDNFACLVEEISAIFRPRHWLLSAAVPAGVPRIIDGYDVPRLANALDFFNVMTYDMHGEWEDYVDHHAPLWRRSFDLNETKDLHSDGALTAWIGHGAPANKIIFGLPFYGRGFKLADANNNQPRAPSLGRGNGGPVTGGLSYFEICTFLKEDGEWEELEDEAGSPYIVKGDQWIGYDTVDSILAKMEYVKSRGLGGAMMWAIDLDDTHGICGPQRPLMNAINQGLVANPMWSDCLRMKSMGYSSSGLYSIKNAQSQPDDDDDSAYKTIYCDFTRHQPVSAGGNEIIKPHYPPFIPFYYGTRFYGPPLAIVTIL